MRFMSVYMDTHCRCVYFILPQHTSTKYEEEENTFFKIYDAKQTVYNS